jgi:phosphate butyryltransferase
MAAESGSIANFEDLLAKARARGSRRCVVACAEDCATIEALRAARQAGIAEGALYGDEQRIATICQSQKFSPDEFEIHNTASQAESIRQAITDVAQSGDFLMKGQIDTATFLRGVLEEDLGLRGDRILSHVALLELPTYKKVLFVTDGGINAELDLRRKIDIVRNAIGLARLLGIVRPKVALLSAVEKITLGIADTLDWAIVTKMGDQGDFGEAVIEGPLALDIAFSPEAAKIKRGVRERGYPGRTFTGNGQYPCQGSAVPGRGKRRGHYCRGKEADRDAVTGRLAGNQALFDSAGKPGILGQVRTTNDESRSADGETDSNTDRQGAEADWPLQPGNPAWQFGFRVRADTDQPGHR